MNVSRTHEARLSENHFAHQTSSIGATPLSPCAATTASDGSLRSSRPPLANVTLPLLWPMKVCMWAPVAFSTCEPSLPTVRLMLRLLWARKFTLKLRMQFVHRG